MATCTLGTAFHNTNNSPQTTGAFTPAAGDLLVCLWYGTGSSAGDTSATATSTGNTTAWTRIETTITFTTAGNNGRFWAFIQNGFCTATSTTVTCDNTVDGTTGQHIYVYRIAGMTKHGSTGAKKQSTWDNDHASGIPMVATMAAACLTGNPTLVCVHDEGTASGWTVPSGWTEDAAAEGFITVPTSRSTAAHRDSGFTGTGVTWGTTSTGNYGAYMLELDASGGAAATLPPRPLIVAEAVDRSYSY